MTISTRLNQSLSGLLDLEAIKAEKARRRLIDFTAYTFSGYQSGWVHHDIAARLDRFLAAIERRESPRLMLFVPPRHGKSELVSRRFPAYMLGRMPDSSVIACSYGADLASRMNRDVQRVIDSEEYRRLFPDTALFGKNIRSVADGSFLRNSDIFEVVGHRGVYRSTGVGGGITGMGCDCLIIDDPIKDQEQANSEAYRTRTWDWYTSTAYTRLMPGGGVLLVQTRWHEDDLAGRLKQAMVDGGDQWEIIEYPAIAERDEEHRRPGDALDPVRYPIERLEAIKTAVGSRVWASLYQQRPAPAEGGIVKLAWFKRYGEAPATPKRIVQSWDTANKAGQLNDPSVCTTWAETDTGYYLLDVFVKRMEYPELKRTAIALAAKWQPHAILIEDKSSGQSLIQDLRAETKLPVLPQEPCADKVTRMATASPLVESGRVFLPNSAPWLIDYEAELTTFPNAAHDDQVDSTSQFLNWARGKQTVQEPKDLGALDGFGEQERSWDF